MATETSQQTSHKYLSVEILTTLGSIFGHRYDTERLHQIIGTVSKRAEGDALAQLALACEDLNLKVTPVHQQLSEPIWHAQPDTPIVVWCKKEEKLLTIKRASSFKVRLADLSAPSQKKLTLSRSALAKRLGLKHVNDTIEVGIVQSRTPMEHASAETERNALSNEHSTADRAHSQHQHTSHESSSDHAHHHISPIKRFLRILKPERRDIVTLLVFALFSGILYLALPFAVDTVVTNLAFGGQSTPYVQALIVVAQILGICLVLQAFIIGFQYYLAEIIQRRIFVRSAGDLAFRLPRVKVKAYDNDHGPELMNRFLDVVTVQKNTAFFLLEGINLVASTTVGMVLLAFYHPLLLLFVAILIVLITFGTWFLGRGAVKSAIEESKVKYKLVGWFEEIASYPFMFKASGGHDLAYQRTNKLATNYLEARSHHFRNVLRQVSGLLFLSIIASVTLLLLGTWLVLSQQISLGQLVASELIMSSIVAALIKLGKKLEAWYDTMAAVDKLGHLFDLETENNTGETPEKIDENTGIHIAASDLSFSYHDTDQFIYRQNFEIKPGEKVAFTGAQGSGLSSMLDLLFTMRQPNNGHLSFDGMDSRTWDLGSLRETVQLLRREEFIAGTIVENLRLGRPEIGTDDIRQALEEVGLLEDILHHPEGLNLKLRVGGAPLSSSQRMRLLFARALVHKPRLLLVDELMDGLDPRTFNRLTKVITASDHPWTVIIATRMPETIAICDWTVNLDEPKAPQHR